MNGFQMFGGHLKLYDMPEVLEYYFDQAMKKGHLKENLRSGMTLLYG